MRGASGFSNYNALNLRINYTEMARKTGLNLVSNLTWGHTIDNLSDTFSSSGNQYNLGLTDPFNPKLDKGDSQFDLRWRFSVGAVWEIPFARNSHGVTKMLADGWVIAPIYTARTGSPYTIYDTTYSYAVYPRLMVLDAAPKTANMTQRPTSTPNLNDYYDMTKLNVYGDYVNPVTNTSDFGPYPAMMTGRDLFRGPGWFNLDLGIYKNTRINERLNTQLRFEMYNALNHANLFLDTGNADWAAANYINSYNSGNRNVQLAIKFLF